MSALARYTHPVDGTIPVPALLYDDEQLLASQDGVGLYDGPNKSATHQSGSIHITSHRLFFIAGAPFASPIHAPPPAAEGGASITLDLNHVTHTESYVGFFTSSPKVTLHLRAPEHNRVGVAERRPSTSFNSGVAEDAAKTSTLPIPPGLSNSVSPAPTLSTNAENPFELWECEICGYRNPPGLSPAARRACGLCGMPRSASSSATPSSSTPRQTSSPRTDVDISAPSPMLISSSRSAKSSTLSTGMNAAHLLSKSLPSSNASSPAPLAISPTSQADVQFGGHGGEGRRRRMQSALACSACTFLNHPSLRECEICGTALVQDDPDPGSDSETQLTANPDLQPPHVSSKSVPTSRSASPALEGNDNAFPTVIDDRERYIKLSFRKGGDKAFYAALKTALQQKEWEVKDAKWSGPDQESSGLSGISGILQNIDTTVMHAERGMSDAFEDLEALMSKAQDMVRLAKGLNEQLTAATHASGNAEPLEPEEATFVRSSLGQLGLSMKHTAVTADMSKDERKYLEQLAVELASVLEEGADANVQNRKEKMGIMREKGIIGLDEIWGRWNRARGVSLVSPEVTLKALPYLPLHTTPPITTRTLTSGLRVLHTPAYSSSAFAARLVGLLVDQGPRTLTDVASVEGLSVGLVDELVKEVEERGDVCFDDPMAGVNVGAGVGVETRWWANLFVEYVWDGQVD
ncbi:EAP30/Vps36 family-domain-containing protein [Phellopilus nigrolimitatus]|nr:EAP30/Vps36 family-domain-containing protein [Phellopilus nigrolimitatus]